MSGDSNVDDCRCLYPECGELVFKLHENYCVRHRHPVPQAAEQAAVPHGKAEADSGAAFEEQLRKGDSSWFDVAMEEASASGAQVPLSDDDERIGSLEEVEEAAIEAADAAEPGEHEDVPADHEPSEKSGGKLPTCDDPKCGHGPGRAKAHWAKWHPLNSLMGLYIMFLCLFKSHAERIANKHLNPMRLYKIVLNKLKSAAIFKNKALKLQEKAAKLETELRESLMEQIDRIKNLIDSTRSYYRTEKEVSKDDDKETQNKIKDFLDQFSSIDVDNSCLTSSWAQKFWKYVVNRLPKVDDANKLKELKQDFLSELRDIFTNEEQELDALDVFTTIKLTQAQKELAAKVQSRLEMAKKCTQLAASCEQSARDHERNMQKAKGESLSKFYEAKNVYCRKFNANNGSCDEKDCPYIHKVDPEYATKQAAYLAEKAQKAAKRAAEKPAACKAKSASKPASSVPCQFGAGCRFLAKGTCRNYHGSSSSGSACSAPSAKSIASTKGTVVGTCTLGSNCPTKDYSCKYMWH